MAKLTGFSPITRRLIVTRAGSEHHLQVRCEGCGVWCRQGWYDLHHRIPRGSGGTRRPEVNGAANGLALCRPDHSWAESHRTEAMDRGWLISAHRKILPSEVPVHLWDGCWLLSDSGDRAAVPCRHETEGAA